MVEPSFISALPVSRMPLIGETVGMGAHEAEEHWKGLFSTVWGRVSVRQVGESPVSGRLRSRRVGALTFNHVRFGNQRFERQQAETRATGEPFFALTFPCHGAARCRIGDQNGHLLPNRVYLLNNDVDAAFETDSDYLSFNVRIPADMIYGYFGREVRMIDRVVSRDDPVFRVLEKVIVEMVEAGDRFTVREADFMTAQLVGLATFYLQNSGRAPTLDLTCDAARSRILRFIDGNYMHDLTPMGIARQCGVSRSYLYKLFSDGPPIMERVRRRRLRAAREMIERGGGMSITDIAMNCGFSSSSELSRQFRAEYGAAPRDFARRARMA